MEADTRLPHHSEMHSFIRENREKKETSLPEAKYKQSKKIVSSVTIMQILQEAQSFPPVAFTKDYIDNIKHPQI
jgi:hypothetical protein